MSHETLMAFAKKKSKPYNLAMRLTAPTLRSLSVPVNGISTLKFGFSPDNITSTATSGGGVITVPVPAGSTAIYFIIPAPTTQLNSFMQFNTGTGTDLITEVMHWEGFPLNRLAFNGLKALTKVPSVLWSACRNMNGMFNNCTAFNQALNWNSAGVTDLTNMFFGCTSLNSPISLNTTSVITMLSMFSGCTAFNQPINFNSPLLDTSSLMFYGCVALDSPVVLNTINVVNMSSMFSGCTVFNQPLNFDTRNLAVVSSMFQNCRAYNQSIVQFIVSKISSMANMFTGCTVYNQDLSIMNFRSSAFRTNYDANCPAWLTANKPKFTA